MSVHDDLQRARELLDAQRFQPNPWDALATEALNSAEQTGRERVAAAVRAVLDEWADRIETDEAARLWAAVRLALPLGPNR